jgi:hypothetical protein
MELQDAKECSVELRDRVREGVGGFFAVAAALVAALIGMAIVSTIVFYASMYGIATWMEHNDPHVFDGPMTGVAPLAAAALVTVIFQIVLLGVLAAFRVPFAKVFMIVLIVFYASTAGAWYLSLWTSIRFEAWYPAGIFSPVPQYSVAVVTPDAQTGQHHLNIVEWSQLKEFCAAHPGYSFLVPDGEVDALKAQLPNHDFVWAIQNKVPNDTLMNARFEVTPLANGRQKIEVHSSWQRNENAFMETWYEADAQQVYPKYFRDGDTYDYYLRNSYLLAGAIDLVGLILYFRWWRRRKALRPVLAPAAAD